jgi:hypothetical protein
MSRLQQLPPPKVPRARIDPTSRRCTSPEARIRVLVKTGLIVAVSLLALVVATDWVQAKGGSQPDGWIAFSYGESGAARPSQLAVMDAEGEHRRALPVYPAYGVSWSPDGAFIAFQTGRNIDKININGPPRSRLVLRNGLQPDWSPSGKAIAFTGPPRFPAPRPEIWIVDLRTGRQRRLFPYGEQPSWSSDGKRLVFVRGRDVWVLAIRTKVAHRLIAHGTPNVRLGRPRLSPDGRRIAFERITESPPEESTIYIARSDGTNQHRLAKGDSLSWSPDGREVAFVGRYGKFGDAIVRMRLDGSHRRMLFGQVPYCGCGSLDWVR